MIISSIKLSQYNISSQPDYIKLGNIVDKEIENTLPDGEYLIRAISSSDHPKLTYDQLIEKIKKLGTDKYDSNRLPVAFEDFKNYDYDIQADSIEIKDHRLLIPNSSKYSTIFGDIIYNFYENALFDRGYRLKIDILLVYDINMLELAKPVSDSEEWLRKYEKYLYKFKKGIDKKDSLVAIFKII